MFFKKSKEYKNIKATKPMPPLPAWTLRSLALCPTAARCLLPETARVCMSKDVTASCA